MHTETKNFQVIFEFSEKRLLCVLRDMSLLTYLNKTVVAEEELMPHIRIRRPKKNGEDYLNEKFFSLFVQAVVNSDQKFTDAFFVFSLDTRQQSSRAQSNVHDLFPDYIFDR